MQLSDVIEEIMAFLDMKLVSKKKVDAKVVMTVSENIVGDRLFIEFSTTDGRFRLEKNFPVTDTGMRDAEIFQTKITSFDDLLNYFSIPKEQ